MSSPPESFRVPPPRRRLVGVGAVAAVAVGGAAGSLARHAVDSWAGPVTGFPWATLLINLTGAFSLGLLVVLTVERLPPTRYVRPLLGTGLLGAFTTYSTFAVASVLLLRDDRIGVAGGYLVATVIGGLVAAYAGARIGRAVPFVGRSA